MAKRDDDEYALEVLKEQFTFFGPYTQTHADAAEPWEQAWMMCIMNGVQPSDMKHFIRMTEAEVCKKDNEFLRWIMKLDRRDRPTASDILNHGWFDGF